KALRHVIAHRVRNGEATRLCHTFEAYRDVYPVAVDVVSFRDHVAKVYADAKLDRVLWFSRAHRRLNLGGTGDCVHNTGKLGEHAVAGKFDDAAPMRGDLGIDYCPPDFFQLCEGPGFVIAHQPAVPDDIGSKNCSETAFHRGSVKALKGRNREMLTRESNRFNSSTLHRFNLYRSVRITSGSGDGCAGAPTRNRTSPNLPFRGQGLEGIVPAGSELRRSRPV